MGFFASPSRGGFALGRARPALVLPPNLVLNGGNPFVNETNISKVGVTTSIVNGALILTAVDGASDRAEFSVSGLTIGVPYRFSIDYSNGNSQAMAHSFTWGTQSTKVLSSTTRTQHSQVITATAISGVCRIYAALSGAAGVKITIHGIAVRRA